MTLQPQENPYEPPMADAGAYPTDSTEEVELYPICVITGTLDNLQKVSAAVIWSPPLLQATRFFFESTCFLMLGHAILMFAAGATRPLLLLLPITLLVALISGLNWLWWRNARRVLTIHFSMAEHIWKKELRIRQNWRVAAVVCMGVFIVLCLMSPAESRFASVFRRFPFVAMLPSLVMISLVASVRNSFLPFSRPKLVQNNGQLMLQLSREYHEMATHIEEIAETLEDDDEGQPEPTPAP